MFKKKLISILLTLIILLTVFSFTAAAYDEDIKKEVKSTYSAALSLAGRRSFHGSCNLATAYQLRARGIYSGDLDYSGAGGKWYNYFKDVKRTSGGYNVITIGGKNCLYELVETYGDPVYDIVYDLGTGGRSGNQHVLYIRAIIDGYVYFADSFACTYGTTYYPEGACTVLTLEKFISAYKGMNGNAYGCVYFSKDKTAEHLDGNNRELSTGSYIITASSLNIRSGAGTGYKSLGLIPNGETVTVTEIKDNWGKTTYNGITGWISLDYAYCTASDASALAKLSLTANKTAVIPGETITWTAKTDSTDSQLRYSFDIYIDDELVYSGDYQTVASFSYTANTFGTYQARVSVKDSKNNEAELYGDSVTCVLQMAPEIGDVDGNGRITALDARIALRAASKLEDLSEECFLRADMDANGKVTSSDARQILRKAANLG